MIYQAYQSFEDMMRPVRLFARMMHTATLNVWEGAPENEMARKIAAAYEILAMSGLTHKRPEFGIDSVRAHTRDLGFDFQAFTNMENGKRHGVVVMAVDPQLLDDKAGPLLGLIGRLKYMPKMLRDPLDAQVRRQTGFSLTDATNPDTPVGAAVAALDQLRDFGGRGIVLIDAVKQ